MRLYGTIVSIVSNLDAKLIARVWKEFQETMGTKSKFNTTFCHQIDGQ